MDISIFYFQFFVGNYASRRSRWMTQKKSQKFSFDIWNILILMRCPVRFGLPSCFQRHCHAVHERVLYFVVQDLILQTSKCTICQKHYVLVVIPVWARFTCMLVVDCCWIILFVVMITEYFLLWLQSMYEVFVVTRFWLRNYCSLHTLNLTHFIKVYS